jgi:CBS domain-containing protein
VRCPQCDHENLPGDDLCASCGLDLAGLDVGAWGVDADDPLLCAPLASLPLNAPIVVEPDTPVSAALDRMRDRHEGCVFVLRGGDLAGVLTERDVCTRVVVPGRDPARTRVADVMTASPVTLRSDDPLAFALHRMGVDGHRHLPVLDGSRLVGFLSVRSVLKALIG